MLLKSYKFSVNIHLKMHQNLDNHLLALRLTSWILLMVKWRELMNWNRQSCPAESMLALASNSPQKENRRKLRWVQTGKYSIVSWFESWIKVKRLEFSEIWLHVTEQFGDMIFTDECYILLKKHSKLKLSWKMGATQTERLSRTSCSGVGMSWNLETWTSRTYHIQTKYGCWVLHCWNSQDCYHSSSLLFQMVTTFNKTMIQNIQVTLLDASWKAME